MRQGNGAGTAVVYVRAHDIRLLACTCQPGMCIAATCNKLRDQRFFLKKIPTHILHYSYELSGNLDSKEVLQNKDIIPEFDLLQPWLDIPPQVPIQNFVQCYGTIKFKDALYTVSDLIQD